MNEYISPCDPDPNNILVIEEKDTFATEPVKFSEKRFNGSASRKELALRLFVSGRLVHEAASDAGLHINTFSKYLNSQEGQDRLKTLRAELDEEFKNLYAMSIKAVRDCLRSPDPTVKLNAANTWLRHSKEMKLDIVLSAEDIIQKLMKGEALG